MVTEKCPKRRDIKLRINACFIRLNLCFNQQFDVIIAEWMFSDIYSGLQAIYGCPFIWFSPIELHGMISNLVDENPNPAYSPDAISVYSPPLSFTERVIELFKQLSATALRYFYMSSNEISTYQEYIVPAIEKRGKQAPSYNDLVYNVSLILANSHYSLGIPLKLPQNVKCIGGYHIDEEVEPLPKDLQKLMDSSKNGVIYFSMGSNLQSKDMPDELKKSLLKMFGTLKQTVIWKFEEDLTDRPSNVHIVKWAPQQSILSHPNVLIFITHGGYLSNNEAVYSSVPFIGIPIFGDQFNNVGRAVRKGYALKVDISSPSVADHLKVAIDEMLNNPSYKEKVKEISVIYHDRIIPPGKELVFWVEHVVKTGGASHLRSPAFTTPWYQKMYLDFALIVLIILYLLKKIVTTYLCPVKSKEKLKTY